MEAEPSPTDRHENLILNEKFQLGMKIGAVLEDEGLKRVLKYFVENGNKPSYHNEIFSVVGGLKTTVSKALHILEDEFNFLKSEYIQIEQSKPSKRMVSVLMFNIVPDYLQLFESLLE